MRGLSRSPLHSPPCACRRAGPSRGGKGAAAWAWNGPDLSPWRDLSCVLSRHWRSPASVTYPAHSDYPEEEEFRMLDRLACHRRQTSLWYSALFPLVSQPINVCILVRGSVLVFIQFLTLLFERNPNISPSLTSICMLVTLPAWLKSSPHIL